MKGLRTAWLCVILLLALGVEAGGARVPPLAYHWPIKPFDVQHPLRGTFGDPRTLATAQPFGLTGPENTGTYSFHNGIDIVAAPRTPVYPVVSGIVVRASAGGIAVHTADGRAFQYWHLRSNVRVGQQVVAEQTVLGWIRRPFNHVHLAEIDNGRAQNPLAPGHLAPYRDQTIPHAIALDFDNGRSPQLTHGGLLSRHDSLAIEAADPAAMRVPGSFGRLPQTPALVEWRLYAHRQWSPWHVAVDFRQTEPHPWNFWNIYTDGTYQNMPVFGRRLYHRRPGHYLFRVDLNTSSLPPGHYLFEARVADVRGNSSTTTWPLRLSAEWWSRPPTGPVGYAR